MRPYAAMFIAILALAGTQCASAPEPPVRQELKVGDRARDWGVVYYKSWRQDHKGDYLMLARRHTSDAVRRYLALQVRLGHSYPDFYDIDQRRVEGCYFLRQLDREALRYGVALDEHEREGCFQ
jgi:hypothetical protein